ncbi:coiled-coil and C2 domain-containing protein 1-like isoform X2 [Ceratina calcarata]|uniref:Coiled-coil and C2 domain-containing protein 1-like isoform X2 n=1 Tax=Ceratina calcarata TaxID=156304 RepID=A0AAJ7IUP9_9HYME|nr:coiled-coil and C2 domain-containing protein 1-like isoform X2 [Ceratina calcarata]
MFGKKEKPKRPPRPPGSLEQFGIFEVPRSLDEIGNNFMDGVDDDDLEAELAALTAGDDEVVKSKRARNKPVPKEEFDVMIAESLKDINIEEEVSDGEDDPDLLSELKMITENESSKEVSPDEPPESTEQSETQEDGASTDSMTTLLQGRLRLYHIAERKAKEKNDSSKARRYARGIRTLKELLTNAQAGKPVDESVIPPELPPHATADESEEPPETHEEPKSPTEPATAAEVDTTSPVETNTVEEPAAPKTVDEEALQLLKQRQQEYKIAAVAWKRAGNMKEALQCVNVAKQFDMVISAVNAGDTIDLSDMPPPPNTPESNAAAPTVEKPEKTESETQGQSSENTVPPVETKSAGPEDLGAALKERLEVCRRIKATAESEGNASKARRYGRICKQFEDAIKLHTRGKPVPISELPTPPGFEPLTVAPAPLPDTSEKPSAPVPENKPQSEPSENKRPKAPTPPSRTQIGNRPNQKSRADKQLALLQQRQHELKQAALNAKKEGDIELARNYLREAKRMDPLIEASMGGLPVDMNSIPLSPKSKDELTAESIGVSDDGFTVVSSEDLDEASGTDEEIYENLGAQLMKQIKSCLCTRDHCKALGDVPGYNKWERLALNYKRDLDMLRVRKRDALPPPQHHYETKTHTMVQSCTDLSDTDIEISIIRGVNYPKDADTYVMFDFPYPSDNPPSDRTATVKGTSNPEYQAVFSLTIDRTSRPCQRAFKRHALKCHVWSKGGFFRSDSLLGTVTVKLQPLESQCELHDSFPVMDGRKPTGGKLEIKIRLRNPIVTKQIESITEKWLMIDY